MLTRLSLGFKSSSTRASGVSPADSVQLRSRTGSEADCARATPGSSTAQSSGHPCLRSEQHRPTVQCAPVRPSRAAPPLEAPQNPTPPVVSNTQRPRLASMHNAGPDHAEGRSNS